MKTFSVIATVVGLLAFTAQAEGKSKLNRVTLTWQPVSATVEIDGNVSLPYGGTPKGKLAFTDDLHFVELLFDPNMPKIRSNLRGGGTDEEKKAIMAGILAVEGRNTIDQDSQFSGNTVEGSSFPN